MPFEGRCISGRRCSPINFSEEEKRRPKIRLRSQFMKTMAIVVVVVVCLFVCFYNKNDRLVIYLHTCW